MLKPLLLIFAFLFPLSVFAQDAPKEYSDNIKIAEEYYDAKEYQKSAEYYSKAFSASGGKAYDDDRYNAACSWATAGNADSAFFLLQKIAERYNNFNHISIDGDLVRLHKDKRWAEILSQVKKNKEKGEEGLNKPLVAILDSIYRDDQRYRKEIDDVEEKYGKDSKQIKELWETINKTDSINLVQVTAILDNQGWLGPDEIGYGGATTLFVVIQHADHATQKKYLPGMKEAVKERKASPSFCAMLEDRVALGDGNRQVYGSQVNRYDNGTYYVSPLEDPDNVDKRRGEMGMQPFADYLMQWNIQWDPEAYKKELPAIEAMLKKKQNK